jgi:2-polyprenyl-3-methyl-5-hydroxy-6-metoxy-1,4-benzoquinol methylase
VLWSVNFCKKHRYGLLKSDFNKQGGKLEGNNSNEWQEFFDGYAVKYDDECFTKNTTAEVEFIVAELGLEPGMSILDMGCGTGRHTVALAQLGYRMTGVDLSAGMLAVARQRARSAGVTVELIQSDATKFKTDARYDAALCLCEGSFGLIGSADDPVEHDLATLRNISAVLKAGAGFILTALNGIRKIRKATSEDIASGDFDPVFILSKYTMEYETPEGTKSITVHERGFVPTELLLMCRDAGLEVLHLWGGTAGAWNRQSLDWEEMEIMIVARKHGDTVS